MFVEYFRFSFAFSARIRYTYDMQDFESTQCGEIRCIIIENIYTKVKGAVING